MIKRNIIVQFFFLIIFYKSLGLSDNTYVVATVGVKWPNEWGVTFVCRWYSICS